MQISHRVIGKNKINKEDLIPELLIGVRVFHKSLLVGEITSIDGRYVDVEFECGEKTFQFPDAFGKYLEIVDVATYKELRREQRFKEIIEKIEERKIERYVHFTNVNNLDSILCEGLVPIAHLRGVGIECDANDVDRWDNRLDANSLSITFPNYQMFYRYRYNNPDSKWVVICYKAKDVAKGNCAYFAQNAASYIYKNKKWEEFTSVNAFNQLFEGEREGLHSFETTNPQAEVMVRGVLPVEYIESISFEDYDLSKEYQIKYPHIKMCYNKHYFEPRRDYEKWSKKDGNQTGFWC